MSERSCPAALGQTGRGTLQLVEPGFQLLDQAGIFDDGGQLAAEGRDQAYVDGAEWLAGGFRAEGHRTDNGGVGRKLDEQHLTLFVGELADMVGGVLRKIVDGAGLYRICQLRVEVVVVLDGDLRRGFGGEHDHGVSQRQDGAEPRKNGRHQQADVIVGCRLCGEPLEGNPVVVGVAVEDAVDESTSHPEQIREKKDRREKEHEVRGHDEVDPAREIRKQQRASPNEKRRRTRLPRRRG